MAYSFTRSFGGKEQTYHVFTREEAEQAGLTFVPWQEARAGDYALTDDGYVGLCVRRQRYIKPKRVKDFFTFSFARQWLVRERATGRIEGQPRLEWEPYRAAGGFYMTRAQSWAEREARRGRTRRAVKLYCRLWLARDGRLTGDDWHQVGLSYRPGEAVPAATAKRLFKQDEVQSLVAKELRQVLADRGITEEELVDYQKKIVDGAIEAGKYGDAFRVTEVWREMLQMGGPPQLTAGEELDFEDELQEAEALEAQRLEPHIEDAHVVDVYEPTSDSWEDVS